VSYFKEVSAEIGKEQYVVPYFISGFPGTTHAQMETVHNYLKEKGWNLQQVQAFIPTPMTLATAMYWTGIDPMTKAELYVAKEWKDRKLQQAMLQRHKPGNRVLLEKYHTQKNATGKIIQRGKPVVAGKPTIGSKPEQPGLRRSIVDVPKNKLGRKLLLDSR
jgi:radical SAM superfamily enzyme YgiQ (UPF0313 family)